MKDKRGKKVGRGIYSINPTRALLSGDFSSDITGGLKIKGVNNLSKRGW